MTMWKETKCKLLKIKKILIKKIETIEWIMNFD
jgi:hypothetical protein